MSKNQLFTIAVIIAVGVVGIGSVLITGRAGGSEAVQEPQRPKIAAAASSAPVEAKPGAAKAESGHANEQSHEELLVKLDDQQIKDAGIGTTAAGPGVLDGSVQFPGEVRFNQDKTAHVVPRIGGVTEAVPVNLGDRVKKGQVLAVIASNALSEQRSELLTAVKRRDAANVTYSREKRLFEEKISAQQDFLSAETALRESEIAVQNAKQKLAAIGASPESISGINRFEIRAPFDGTIVEKHITLGEAVREDTTVFTLADLSTVWTEFVISPQDLAIVREGQRAIVSSTAFASEVEGTVSYIGSLIGEQTRTASARVTIRNPDGAWRPGLFVTVSVFSGKRDAAMVVPLQSIQTIEEKTMVFKKVEGGFEALPIQVGKSDGKSVEVKSGLAKGDQIAIGNTYTLKAELGKNTAGHED